MGKTALAVHWAHRAAAGFPDGQLYADLRGSDPGKRPPAPGDVLRGFLTVLGAPASQLAVGLDVQVGLYRSLLADRRIMVVLDDARDAEQVRPLLPGATGGLALITSRNRLSSLVALEGARLIMLDVLDETQARTLLAARLGNRRLAAEPTGVDAVVAACAGLPLALAIAAARAVAQPELSLGAVARELAAGDLQTPESWDRTSDLHAVIPFRAGCGRTPPLCFPEPQCAGGSLRR